MKNKVLLEIICFMVSVVFIYAGMAKLIENETFLIQLDKSPLLPDQSLKFISLFFPILEIFTGIGLFFKRYQKNSLYLSLFLFALFTLYLIILNLFFIDVPCSCGGILGKMSYLTHIIFNLSFVLLIVLAIKIYEKIN